MAEKALVNRMVEISETDDWRFVRSLMEKELERVTNIDNLEGGAQLEGAKLTKKAINKIINQIDGARNTLDING